MNRQDAHVSKGVGTSVVNMQAFYCQAIEQTEADRALNKRKGCTPTLINLKGLTRIKKHSADVGEDLPRITSYISY